MHKIKNIRGYVISSLYLIALLSSTTVISFGMEGQKEETPGAAKASKQSLMGQFTTINEKDLYPYVYSEVLKKKLNETVNKERYLKCDLTNHYAEYIVRLLNGNASSEEIYKYLKICKTITEPGAAEATVRNNMPQGVSIPYAIINHIFGSVGIKYSRLWDDSEILLQAHKYGAPLKWDAEEGKYIPLVLSAKDQERYQAHHDFRVAIHGFYKDYIKLLNVQRAEKGEHPLYDRATDYSKSDPLEKPMTEEEKQEFIRLSKAKVEEFERGKNESNIIVARRVEEARRKEEERQTKELEVLKRVQEKVGAEQQKLRKEDSKIQDELSRLSEQVKQNEEKMRALTEKLKERQKEKEEEERKRQQKQSLQLLKDEELARALDQELNGDEEFARNLDRQLNG